MKTTSNAYDAEPARSLRIGLLTRLADAWDARRNAVATPARPNPLDDRPSTLRLEAIGHHHNDAVHGEYLNFLKDTATDRIELARLRAQLADLEQARRSASARRDAVASAPVAQGARPGEESLTTAAVERRRQVEHNLVVAAVDADVQKAIASASQVERQVAETVQRISERLAAAQTRARRIHERDSARRARYLAVLCRRHPDGVELNSKFTAAGGLRLPDWVSTDTPESIIDELAWAA